MNSPSVQTDPRDRFIERFALSMERDGMPRIAGRIFAFLLLEGDAFTFEELAERLKVSRGSVSTNTRNLEAIGLIERIAIAGERKTRYQLVREPFTPMLASAQLQIGERQQIVDELLSEASEDGAEPAGYLERLHGLRDFQALAIEWLDKLTETWKEQGGGA